MIHLLILTGMLLTQGDQSAAPVQDTRPLVQTLNEPGAARCLGSMVGFRNVPLRCVVGPDGALEQCEVLSSNRTVLRYSRVYLCMASQTRVTYRDGTPAVGRSIAVRINGVTVLSSPQP